ncbi:MAG TPA: ATP synthase F1 subunit epsilon [Polyangiaceae bacterium LLY-WYZ-15_(1-7)]|nr:ATP synthase F1 subunit epsilon [Sandaracinus sp.]HJK90579.1 ATP synthase F1 subunit epsilon [Polyangiaceae bacterium LLY-WYZ-15_(1-7)]HJL00631.1 ATP synthase F1 subunit epsilon [Polyangiaceae bacterium LLY-WYZ-15_(1-7)]HJL13169.1 ATP synthase F1 subunit epsilon [Polyangiaceae bacterium LLY-WYZ-15_(1-7)]HJL20693.1 ATP synthase F1 subunit epsilon [Polyangiaceae bacterium LLY-WYZ-15_(1-7)]
MADILMLEVTTPTGLALETEAEYVQAPSVQGEFGVLPNHLPVLAALKCGLMKYKANGQTHVACIGPGFIEAEPDRVIVLSDLFASPESIDVDEAKKELDEAVKTLAAYGERHEGPEYEELQRDIDWAQARIDCVAEADRLS